MKKGNPVNPTSNWHFLLRESQFAAESMAAGVTVLGKSNYARIAFYIQMLFSVSIGLERTSKLILCFDHLIRHGSYPNNDTIKNYRHNLKELLMEVEKIGTSLNETKDGFQMPDSQISRNIIQVLSDFGRNITRYYYLDSISGTVGSDSYDPVAAWHRDVSRLVLQEHLTEQQKATIESEATVLNHQIGDITFVEHTSEDLTLISDVYTGFKQSALAEIEIPFTRMYVLQICRFVSKVIIEVSNQAHTSTAQIPSMIEIFAVFLGDDREFKKKKTWSVY